MNPFFLIYEKGSRKVSRRNTNLREMTPDIIYKMMDSGIFDMRQMQIGLENKLSETEILFCFNQTESFPISGFPRCLLRDEREQSSKSYKKRYNESYADVINNQKHCIRWLSIAVAGRVAPKTTTCVTSGFPQIGDKSPLSEALPTIPLSATHHYLMMIEVQILMILWRCVWTKLREHMRNPRPKGSLLRLMALTSTNWILHPLHMLNSPTSYSISSIMLCRVIIEA